VGLMKLSDGTVDAGSESEVVGVDDEAGGHSSVILAQRCDGAL
jgi:hypothetical protein